MYKVRKLRLERTQQLDDLTLAAGALYSRTVTSFWRIVRHKGLWLKPSSMMRWHNSNKLHAHSADAVVQSFYSSLRSWRVRRKDNPDAKPPFRRKRFYKVQWKSSAIRLRNGKLILSNGKGNDPLIVPWRWDCPKLVELGWNDGYELRAVYDIHSNEQPQGDKVVGIDLGEIHPAVAHDGEKAIILNGRLLRSKRQYQNKLKAKLSSILDRKKKGSRRWRRLQWSKQRQLAKINNQIRDILHKQTTRLVSMLHERGVQTLVVGDVRDIRQRVDYGHSANQRIHQMVTGKTRWMLTYKAKAKGMDVVLQDEKYTSQTCPSCGTCHKPNGRQYVCKCGFRYHRDAVGAWNIRQKYLGYGPVVGAMASPIGVRYWPHMWCSSH
ncbi:RNA-guided endonuclease InsQ/TnpB family protein [Alicyclobacillus kakegawensis]|uniref:RNA-guided endonuclease InsQ/TnpB family protein n=1 Tax=Alicyclobacillus kakegawensis TaxID=392012 RepID=UPI0008346802|nr:RNA-guided endonuclease TnpB family protein [Alicyclobacillus kakegawensis]